MWVVPEVVGAVLTCTGLFRESMDRRFIVAVVVAVVVVVDNCILGRIFGIVLGCRAGLFRINNRWGSRNLRRSRLCVCLGLELSHAVYMRQGCLPRVPSLQPLSQPPLQPPSLYR